MPCVFCFAALTLLAGAITARTVDHLHQRLATLAATGEVERVSDTGSVTLFHLAVPHPQGSGHGSTPVPVAVTLYKHQARVRIQVLTHTVDPTAARTIESRIATTLDAHIVEHIAAPAGHAHAEPHADQPVDAVAQPVPRQAWRPGRAPRR
ncbi:hypothetical protein [Kitasatospora sp. NBC_01302]|uniref:hypothetical protein n=1 Tax=Kitasatospora sp. NBC_01302 TaxID=2903575 RepID=UPI002E0F1EDC|nr:hypothetical protein OG294_03820 [Kitasatospora sp. NBC_01302]